MLITNLNKLGQLSPGDRRLLFQAVLLLPILHIALFFLGYYRLHGIMERLIPLNRMDTRRSEAEVLQQARDTARIVAIAAGHGFFQATCLRRSLLVWWFLRRQGIQSRICFGVRMIDRKLEAHAWVEYNTIVVNDAMDVHKYYRPLNDVLPATKLGL